MLEGEKAPEIMEVAEWRNSLEKPKTEVTERYHTPDTWKHETKAPAPPSHSFYMDLPRIPIFWYSSFFYAHPSCFLPGTNQSHSTLFILTQFLTW